MRGGRRENSLGRWVCYYRERERERERDKGDHQNFIRERLNKITKLKEI
jgi:hypothetical protein